MGRGEGGGGGDDNVSPVQALSDEYRLQFAELVFQLRGERMLNSESKLIVVNSAIENLLPLVPELVPGSVLAKVDKHPPRARTAKQLGDHGSQIALGMPSDSGLDSSRDG